jgi:hypothetical protein
MVPAFETVGKTTACEHAKGAFSMYGRLGKLFCEAGEVQSLLFGRDSANLASSWLPYGCTILPSSAIFPALQYEGLDQIPHTALS